MNLLGECDIQNQIVFFGEVLSVEIIGSHNRFKNVQPF
jgi:hypothetical protein